MKLLSWSTTTGGALELNGVGAALIFTSLATTAAQAATTMFRILAIAAAATGAGALMTSGGDRCQDTAEGIDLAFQFFM